MAIILHEEFSPLHIPGCALWLEADWGVDTVDGKVSLWRDRSGNGRHASQSDAAKRPAYVTGALNGWPVARFDATDNFMSYSGGTIINNHTGASVVVVVDPIATPDSYLFHLSFGIFHLNIRVTTSYLLSRFVGNTDGYGVNETGAVASNPQIIAIVFDGTQATDAAKLKQFLNGSQQTLAFYDSPVPTVSGISSTYYINSYTSSSKFSGGDYAFIGLYQKTLNSTELQSLAYHLGNKYGIALAA